MANLRQRIDLIEIDRDWLNNAATRHHYMHRPVHQRACPFGWAVTFDGQLYQPDGVPSGFIVFASIHYTRLRGEFGCGGLTKYIKILKAHKPKPAPYTSEFTYPGLPTKWQVLSLARLWLHDNLPKYSETVVLGKALAQRGHEQAAPVQTRWLEIHPPRFLDEPYHITKIVADSDTRYHRGTIYRAANFREYKREDGKPIISQKRHKNTRGNGLDGAELKRFIYDLQLPKFEWRPAVLQLPLMAGAAVDGVRG